MSGRVCGRGLVPGMNETAVSPVADVGALRARVADAVAAAARAAAEANARLSEMLAGGCGSLGSMKFIQAAEAAVYADGEASQWEAFSAVAAGAGDVAASLSSMLLDHLLRSPHDTWSGRGNDLRRAHRDGGVAACKRLRTELRLVGVEAGR